MDSIIVSCIITTYKRDIDTFMRAFDSIIGQTYKNLEIIVVNDAPKETELSNLIRNRIEKYDGVKYIIHKENSGACAARNTGIKKATGKYIAFLDDDDEWLPNKIEIQVEIAERLHCAMVFCPFIAIDKNGQKRHMAPFEKKGLTCENIYSELMVRNCIGSTSGPLLKRESVIDVGMFDVNIKASQDLELWIRISKKYTIEYCTTALFNYYFTNDSITRSIENRLQATIYLEDKYKDYYKEHKNIYNRRLNADACMFVSGYRNYKYALKYWFKAFSLMPFSKYNLMPLEKILLRVKKRFSQ